MRLLIAWIALLSAATITGCGRSAVPPLPGEQSYGATTSSASGLRNRGTYASYKVIHTFTGGGAGATPYGGALVVENGMLYGTTQGGGTHGDGTIYTTSLSGQNYRVLVSFGKTEQSPNGLVVYNGLLYGTSEQGGAYRNGALFSVDPSGKEYQVLYSFKKDSAGGDSPLGNLVVYDGMLYGTTGSGGANGVGTVFAMNPASHAYHVVYNFGSSADDGVGPNGSLVVDNGVLYGMTFGGGAHGEGSIFAVTQLGVLTIYSFKAGADGATPNGGLTVYDSNLWGTTQNGGANNSGTIFEVTPLAPGQSSVQERVKYSFGGDNTHGEFPYAGLVCNKACYGTTASGGTSSDGTIFGFTSEHADRVSTVRSFKGGNDGFSPFASLLAYDGVLYGTTPFGGGSDGCGGGCGTIFALTP